MTARQMITFLHSLRRFVFSFARTPAPECGGLPLSPGCVGLVGSPAQLSISGMSSNLTPLAGRAGVWVSYPAWPSVPDEIFQREGARKTIWRVFAGAARRGFAGLRRPLHFRERVASSHNSQAGCLPVVRRSPPLRLLGRFLVRGKGNVGSEAVDWPPVRPLYEPSPQL